MYFTETHTYSYRDRWRTFKRAWKMVHFLSRSLSNKQITIFQAEVSDEGKEFLIFRHGLFCISISTTVNAGTWVVTVGDTNNFPSQSEDQRSQLCISKQPHRNSWQVEVLAQPEHAHGYGNQLYCVWFIPVQYPHENKSVTFSQHDRREFWDAFLSQTKGRHWEWLRICVVIKTRKIQT